MKKLSSKEIEEIRLNYKPNKIKVLFIGESPPKGGAFFYLARSALFENTKEVFSKIYNREFNGSDKNIVFPAYNLFYNNLKF